MQLYGRQRFIIPGRKAPEFFFRASVLRRCILASYACFFILVLQPAAAADITVPQIEMAGRGWMDDGKFVLSSVLSADIDLSGGYKYSFLLGFSLEAPDIARAFANRNFQAGFLNPGDTVEAEDYNALAEKLNNQAYLGFRLARATLRSIFGIPLDLSYFIGQEDDFCTGDEFAHRFGLEPFGTDFRGFYYFPEGIGGNPIRRYNGIYSVRGTGLSLSLTKWQKVIPYLYLYQDFYSFSGFLGGSGENIYSGDIRVLVNHSWLKFEGFMGFSLNSSSDAGLRGGIMFHLDSGKGVEFFAQGGIPGFTLGEKFSIDNVFFLIEPRLRFGIFGLYVTFFYHPIEYIHIITPEERGKANINIKFLFGKTLEGVNGGVELGAGIDTNDITDNFTFSISPFTSFIASGLRWDAKIRIKPLEYKVPEKIFDFIIGVRTAF